VTLHNPGQVVVYPILDLRHWKKDIRFYLEKLEQVAIDLLKDFDIVANRLSDKRGLWVGQKKIVSIGIGIKKWITFHGMSINVNNDLKLFSLINPCGLNIEMTSIQALTSQDINLSTVKQRIQKRFEKNFLGE